MAIGKLLIRCIHFVLGAYVDMRQEEYYGKDFQLFAEVRSDEKCSPMGLPDTIKRCTIIICCLMMAIQGIHMKEFIKVVAKANNLINFDINKLDNAAANQVEANYYVGQAYALRALGFFDLLRLYGQNILEEIRVLYFL